MSVGRGVCQKTDDLVKRGLVEACVFMDVLEIGLLLGSGLVDDPRGAHQINVFKAFLEDIPGFLRALPLDDYLMLVGHEFGDYASRFTNSQVVLFFAVHDSVYENIGLELGSGEFLFDEIVSDDFDFRPLSPRGCPLESMLSEFAHYVLLSSCVVC